MKIYMAAINLTKEKAPQNAEMTHLINVAKCHRTIQTYWLKSSVICSIKCLKEKERIMSLPGRWVSWKRREAALMAVWSNGSLSSLSFALNPLIFFFEAHVDGGRKIAVAGACAKPTKLSIKWRLIFSDDGEVRFPLSAHSSPLLVCTQYVTMRLERNAHTTQQNRSTPPPKGPSLSVFQSPKPTKN